MPDRSNDEVAKALEQLAAGQAGESAQPPPARTPAPAGKPRPAAPAVNRPAQPGGASSARPMHPPGMAPPPAPKPPAARATGPIRPQMPVEAPPVDEDDAVIVPPPPASAFLPYRTPAVAGKRTGSLTLRRTVIPILLTCGVILLVLGTMPFFLSTDNPLSALPRWISLALWGTGLFLLALAVVNMLAVKQMTEAARQAPSR